MAAELLTFLPALILGPPVPSVTGATSTLTGSTQKLAQRFVPDLACTVDSLDVRLTKTGTPGSIKIRFETESAGLPSGTLYAANSETGTFTPSATGWTGVQALTASPALTAGVPVWIVIEPVAGTHDGSNNWGWWYLTTQATTTGPEWQRGTYNGSAWTITINRMAAVVLTLSTATKVGNIYHTYSGTSRTISGTGRVGLKFDVDVETVIRQFKVYLSASNSAVGDLEVKVYDTSDVQQGSTQTYQVADFYGVQTVTTASVCTLSLAAQVTLAAGSYWLSLHQAADASTHNWRVPTLTTDYGTESVGTGGTEWQLGTRTADSGAWSTVTTEEAMYQVIFESQAGGGGGSTIIVMEG